MEERFFVWGIGEIPDWLKKAGAIRATETELDAAEFGADDHELFDWTVVLNIEEAQIVVQQRSEPSIKGFMLLDHISGITCTEPGKWNYPKEG